MLSYFIFKSYSQSYLPLKLPYIMSGGLNSSQKEDLNYIDNTQNNLPGTHYTWLL